jgi:hypothetical protein
MPTRCSDVTARLAILCCLILPALVRAETNSASALPRSDEEFVGQLLKVADETDPRAVPATFWATFAPELAQHTRVLVSGLLTSESPNNVVRFVRLGEEWYPLSYGGPGECVAVALIDRQFRADGWQGGRSETPGESLWLYRKGQAQLSVQTRTAKDTAASCALSLLLTYR